MKMLYGTAEPKIVVVDIAPEEVRIIYHGEEPDLVLHPAIFERTQEVMGAAVVDDGDIVSSYLDMSEDEWESIFASAVYYTVVPVVRARAPRRKIWRRRARA